MKNYFILFCLECETMSTCKKLGCQAIPRCSNVVEQVHLAEVQLCEAVATFCLGEPKNYLTTCHKGPKRQPMVGVAA